MRQQIDAYGYLFNAEKFEFPAKETVANFCAFFDNIYCATVPSEDNTRVTLEELEKKYTNFHVIDTEIKIIGNNRFDGELKTVALSHCKSKLRCIVDFDEYFPISNRPMWDKWAENLLNSNFDGIQIPVIDCWGSKKKIRANHPIGQKFRLHKDTVEKRGVLPEAELADGRFRTDLSDSTEPLLYGGDLAKFAQMFNSNMDLHPLFASNLVNFPYCLHLGTINFERRAKIGRDFWKSRWEERSGHEENVVTNKNLLDSEITIEHGLPIE
jgi:hypothetical protein